MSAPEKNQADIRAEIDAMQGIKEEALNKLGPCAVCGKPLLDAEKRGLMFYRVRIERCIWDPEALQQQVGLGMMLGGSTALARIMGADRDLAKVISGPHDVVVHDICDDKAGLLLVEVPALAAQRAQEEKEARA